MKATSRQTLFRSFLLCAVVAVGLSVGGCDLFGSDDSPGWTGNWKPVNSNDVAWSISESEVKTVSSATIQGNTQCQVATVEITNVDGNEVTAEEPDGDESTATFDVNGDMLDITDGDGATREFESIDEGPEDFLGCDVVNNTN